MRASLPRRARLASRRMGLADFDRHGRQAHRAYRLPRHRSRAVEEPSASSARSSPGACGCFCRSMPRPASEALSRLFMLYPPLAADTDEPQGSAKAVAVMSMSYASELSRRLAARAEAVCRAYLPEWTPLTDATGSLATLPAPAAAACSSNSGATGRPLDGWRNRRAWRPARSHPAQQGLEGLPRSACRSAPILERARAHPEPSQEPAARTGRTTSVLPPRSSTPCRARCRARSPRPICADAASPRAFLALPSFSSRLLLPSR